MKTLEKMQEEISQLEGEERVVIRNLRFSKKAGSLLDQEIEDLLKAKWLIAEASRTVQKKASDIINKVVTIALRTVYPERKYSFQFKFGEDKSGKTIAKPIVIENGEEFDPKYDKGGGVRSISAFVLKISIWLLETPRKRNFFFFDEPFGAVGVNLIPKIGMMLKRICEKLKVQIIMITHETAFGEIADKHIHVSYRDKRSHCEEVKK